VNEDVQYAIQFRPNAPSNIVVYNTHLTNIGGVQRAPASVDGDITPFNSAEARAGRCKNLDNVTLYQYDWEVYPVTTGPLVLSHGYDGCTITVQNQSAGALNVQYPGGTIQGGTTANAYTIPAFGNTVTLQWGTGNIWYIIGKSN
jgi:hypothetical protein